MFGFFSKRTNEARSDDILPIVVPTRIVTHGQWPGSFLQWNDILSVTWAHFQEPCNTVYLTKLETEGFTSQRKNYQQIAIDNLRLHSRGRAWSHIKKEGDTVFYLGLLHEDGLGPSRLLLREELREIFPDGYSFCVPERTCALVFSRHANDSIMTVVQGLIAKCHQNGREPVSERIIDEEEIKLRQL